MIIRIRIGGSWWSWLYLDSSLLLQSSHTNVGDQASSAKVSVLHLCLNLHPELDSHQIVIIDPEFWSLSSFFSSPSSFPSQSPDQICQEKYPLRGWESMKFQIQSPADKMSLLAYLAWIEHSSGTPCPPLIWSLGLSLHQGPLTQGLLSNTDSLTKSLHTKPIVEKYIYKMKMTREPHH